ncbi:MAG TPA: glycerol-3-phosphate dehydrogenase [Gammaproteobacteria bacterium]
MDEPDLLIIGGGINGAGIARDAAGRGLRVTLCDKGDLGGATSSASTKLIHGGLRYLEHYEFRLVRESLAEREALMRIAPHLVRPIRIIMPHVPALRPMWMMRLGLYLYDHLGGKRSLPGSRAIDLEGTEYGSGLRSEYRRALAYSDCRADDARLVMANMRSAAELGARILPRTRFEGATPDSRGWRATLTGAGTNENEVVLARCLVNAGGPWVDEIVRGIAGARRKTAVRLVKGSHIVLPRLYQGDYALLLQNDDRRVIFVIPFDAAFSLVGTTDVPVESSPGVARITPAEIEYLCRALNRFFEKPVDPGQVCWTYAGVRPLHDDGETNPSKISRDYDLERQQADGSRTLLNVYGGKLTTYRHLAEHALEKLAVDFPSMGPAWTDTAVLPGGDIPQGDFEAFVAKLRAAFEFVPEPHLRQLARRHGSRCAEVLGSAAGLDDLGQHFANGLYAREVDYLREYEWAQTADDILWRRTKCGLGADERAVSALESYLAGPLGQTGREATGD